jgi:hypothetical protein
LVNDLRDLVKREAEQQVAEIDKELEALSVLAEEFETWAIRPPLRGQGV